MTEKIKWKDTTDTESINKTWPEKVVDGMDNELIKILHLVPNNDYNLRFVNYPFLTSCLLKRKASGIDPEKIETIDPYLMPKPYAIVVLDRNDGNRVKVCTFSKYIFRLLTRIMDKTGNSAGSSGGNNGWDWGIRVREKEEKVDSTFLSLDKKNGPWTMKYFEEQERKHLASLDDYSYEISILAKTPFTEEEKTVLRKIL